MNLTALGEDGCFLTTPAVTIVVGEEAVFVQLGGAAARKGHGAGRAAQPAFTGDISQLVVGRILSLLPWLRSTLSDRTLVAVVGAGAGRDARFGLLSTRHWLEGLPFVLRPLRGQKARYLPEPDLVEVDPTFGALSTDAELRDTLLEECLHRALHRAGLRTEIGHHGAMSPALAYAARLPGPGTSRVPTALVLLGAVGLAALLAGRR